MSTTRRIHLRPADNPVLVQGMASIQHEMKLPIAFPPEVEAAAANPRLPELDRTEVAQVTIDPPESMDLDQALYVETHGEGYRVYYAIADVAAFVRAGDPVDREANRRGETFVWCRLENPVASESAFRGRHVVVA